MEEIGIVKDVIGTKAIVVIQKQRGCESCPGSALCKTVGGDEAQIEALNRLNAGVGDTVKISFKSYSYLKGTALIYGLPALMLIIGAVVGKEYISRLFLDSDADLISGMAAFGFFFLSFIIVKIWVKFVESKKTYMPIISDIVNTKN